MKVITIKQPWATLIAKGLKQYEFRTWKTNYRGDILIHASKSVDKEAMNFFSYLNFSYPTGCLIARATMTDCVKADSSFRQEMLQKDEKIYHNLKNTNWQGYGFKLENVRSLKPTPVKGNLSLWECDIDISNLLN